MKIKKKKGITVFDGIIALLLCFLTAGLPMRAESLAHPAEMDGRCRQWVDSVFSQMSREEKIGQLVVAVVPARADRQTKKLVRDLAKRQKIGGLQFYGGTTEAQALLTNLAQKNATLPVMVLPAGKRLADGLSDVPVFPDDEALRCISDPSLLEAYTKEVQREYRELGMADSCLLPDKTGPAGLPDDMAVTWRAQAEVARLQAAVSAGELSAAELDARCRQVLAYKYRVGLRHRQSPLQVDGIGQRVNSEEAQALAGRLRQASVTVVNNYFDVLPLSAAKGGTAVLSIGEAGKGAPFVEALKKYAEVDSFRLDPDADEAACKAVEERLKPYRRLVVAITETPGHLFVGQQVSGFLGKLDVQAPVVYVLFAPQFSLLPLGPAVARSNALVLAHSSGAALQRYVADVLFAKATADGRLATNIGRTFPAGSGCDIRPGMEPGRLVPEDSGLKSYVLRRVDQLAQRGVDEKAYPGCRVLIVKDGQAIYNKGFGTHSDTDPTAVRATDLFDLGDLTKPMATVLAVMKLYDEGKLKIDEKASAYLPALRRGDKKDITVRELLMQQSGLPPHIRFYMDIIDPHSVHGPYAQSWVDEWHKTRISEHSYFCSDFKFKNGMVSPTQTANHTMQMAEGLWLNKNFKNTLLQAIAKSDLGGKRSVDSNPGFILLQQIVETLSGQPLDSYVAKEFYEPMGLTHTLFRPLEKYGKDEIMPTSSNDFLRRQDLCGYVHNEAAACLGGVAGNAGLFSTAEEVAKVFQMLLDGGEWNGKRLLSEATCRLFTAGSPGTGRYVLGFERPDSSSASGSQCPPSTPSEAYGQTGYTGTCVWADPKNNLVFVFLSNRLCPNVWNTKLTDMKICREIQELVYRSLEN